MFPCIKCGDEVRIRQHAVSCDECGHWQHRKCDTGITFAQYQDAKKGRITLSFICVPCSDGERRENLAASILAEESSPTRENTEAVDIMETEQIQENSELVSQNTETSDELMEEGISYEGNAELDAQNTEALAELMEEGNSEAQNPENTSLDASFDIGHRSIVQQQETMETSIVDPDMPDVLLDDSPVTFEILPNGSKRGAPLLISSDGFSFGIKTKKQSKVRWRCSVRSKSDPCMVTVAQDGDNFIQSQHRHNHPHDPKLKIKKTTYAKAKESAKQSMFKPAMEIVEETISDTVTDDTAFLKPKNATVKRVINKFRAKTRPETPKDLNFEINTDFLNMDEFLIADIKMETCRHLVFSTPFQARRWFIDGTFKIVGKPFTPNGQLMSINAFIQKDGEKRQFPLVFALMSKRRKTDYVAVLKSVLEKMDEPEVDSFVLDFESGAWQAIREVFPGKGIKGCVFHWTQAVYRRVQNLGLSTAYREQGAVFQYIRQLLALPFLPSEHIKDTFETLKGKANSEALNQLVSYIESQWMENTVFEISSWSVFGQSVRTNNDVEAWHRRLNCKGAGLSFYKLVPVLLREAELVKINVTAGDLQVQRRSRTTKMEEKLEKAWEQYRQKEVTTSRFLKICATIYKMVQ